MGFIKRATGFFSRWGDLAMPTLLFLFCMGLMMLSNVSRTLSSGGRLERLITFPQFFENKFYDLRVSAQIPDDWIDPDTVIVTLDDKTLSSLGTWPIPRKHHAELIRKLKSFGARVVALDILFAENYPLAEQDAELAQAIKDFRSKGREVILSYSMTDLDPEEYPVDKGGDALTKTPDFAYMQSGDAQLKQPTKPFWINRHTIPIDEFLSTEALVGHIGNHEDVDGVFRHYRIIANLIDEQRESVYVASMGLAAAEAFSGEKAKVFTNANGQAILNFRGKHIAVDELGEIKVRYSARGSNYQSVSYFDVISASDDDKEMKNLFAGKLVMVGSTAEGAHDLRNSPIDPKMPGMYAHTNVTHMLLHGFTYESSEESWWISMAMAFSGTLLLILVQRKGNAIFDILALAFAAGGVIMIDKYYFLPRGFELKLFYCLLCFFAIYSWTTFINFWRAAKEKKQIKGTFARYVSPAIVNEMLDNPEKLKVGGEKRDITCLFSDVRDFTSISEGLTATELSGALNRYMGRMTDIVFETKGTLDKYIGDAIVAFWGAPLDLSDHPTCAVEGAVKMMEALPAINEEFKQKGLPEFKVGIGLNSGECSVGNMGSDKIFSYTALGDNMNLGARLESLCKHYGAQILISEYTLARLPEGKFKTRPIDKVIVKGKTKPVAIYEVIHSVHPLSKDTDAFDFYNQAWKAFISKDFGGAQKILEGMLLAYPEDKPTARLLKVCQRWQHEAPPEDFDVTKMTEK